MSVRRFGIVVGALALCSLSQLACAHQQGDMFVRLGGYVSDPQVKSSTVSTTLGAFISSRVKIGSDAGFAGSWNYMADDHMGVSFMLATPSRHELRVEGMPFTRLGRFKMISPALTFDFYPNLRDTAFQPYMGVGMAMNKIFSKKVHSQYMGAVNNAPTGLSMKSKFGIKGVAGFDYHIYNEWFLHASATYQKLNSNVKLSSSAITTPVVQAPQMSFASVDINPVTYHLGVAYKY